MATPRAPSGTTMRYLVSRRDPLAPVWSAVPSPAFTQGIAATYSLSAISSDPANAPITYTSVGAALPSGVTIAGATLSYNGAGSPTTATALRLRATSSNGFSDSSIFSLTIQAGAPLTTIAEADWRMRTSDAGVIWHHNFDSDTEVAKFKWMGGVGQDINGTGDAAVTGTPNIVRVPSGGAGGGGYLQITHPVGVTPNRKEVGQWWRMFSPLDASSTGRGTADPGGYGIYKVRPDASTISAQAFTPTQGGSQLTGTAGSGGWASNTRAGYYGPSAVADGKYDGTDFYIQIRVMADPRRTTPGMNTGGKFPWITTTNASNPNQELVTVQAFVQANTFTAAGQPNYHMMYSRNGGFTFEGVGGGTAIHVGKDWTAAVCDPYNSNVGGCWNYATDGTWDTLLYHISPGVSGGANTRIEVWAAHQGDVNYVKLWDVMYDAAYSTDFATDRHGWNALLLTAYNNGYEGAGGVDSPSAFWTRYDEIIFSRNYIPAPAGNSALAVKAASMASGTWAQMTPTPTGLGLFNGGPNSGIKTLYAEKMAHDPLTKRIYWMGSDHSDNGHFLQYSEATNAWTELPQAPFTAATVPPCHGYEHTTVDTRRGKVYFRDNASLSLYRWESGTTWTEFSLAGTLAYASAASACQYFPDLDRVMIYQVENGTKGALVGLNPATGTFTTYVSGSSTTLDPTGDPHNFCVYNPISHMIVFGGGNGVSSLWKMDSSGTITALTAIPPALGLVGPGYGAAKIWPNPINGNFIVILSNSVWYDLDASGAGTWTARTGTVPMIASNTYAANSIDGSIGVSYPQYGVIVFVKAFNRLTDAEMWLFKL